MGDAEPIYLYGHGRLRHIASGRPSEFGGRTFCGNWHATDAAMTEHLIRWNGETRGTAQAQRRRDLQVCKRCQTGWDAR